MITIRQGQDVLICDCCARQIVDYDADNEYCVGPANEVRHIGLDRHCCHRCYPDYKGFQDLIVDHYLF